MADDFNYDVFLSHSSKDKSTVRAVAERLQADGLRVWFDEWALKAGDSVPAKIEEGLEQSRVLVLCMSADAFGSDWAQLEGYTFRFRDPLNKERRFIPLRLDEAPIKGSLAQFLYIDWLPDARELEYAKLLDACHPPQIQPVEEPEAIPVRSDEKIHLLGHTDWVRSVAFSPDGKYVLSGSDDETVRVWEVESGRCLRVLKGHTYRVLSVAWSSDGRQALSSSLDKTVRVWEIESGRCLWVLKGHTASVNCVAWSSNGRQVLSGSADKTVRVWEVETGRCLRVLEGHTASVLSVAWNSDGPQVLSGSADKTVRVWEVETGRCLRVLEGHANNVYGVAWSGDGRYALSGSADKTMRVWEVETGHCLRVLEGHTESINCVAWSSDGRYGLSGSSDKTVRAWELETGRCLRVLEGHTARVNSVAWSSDGRMALSGSNDETLQLWEVETGRRLRVLEGHTASVNSIAWSNDGRYALSGSSDMTVRLWEVETKCRLRVLKGHTASVNSIAWSSDGRYGLSGSSDKTVRVWEVETGRRLRVLEGHTDSVLSVAWNSDGRQALSGSLDRTVRVWEVETGRCLGVLEGHNGGVLSVACNGDSKQALSGSADNTVRVWEMETGRCLRVLKGHTDDVLSVAWSGDGRYALSGSADNTVRVWEVETGRCLRVLEGHTQGILSVAWSGDGRYALSGSADNTVRVWEVETGRCLRVLEGHTDSVLSVAWNSDGRYALSGTDKGVMRMWNLSEYVTKGRAPKNTSSPLPTMPEQIQYTNAKVLLVGDSGVGKTGLSNYLALGIKDEGSNTSTDGAWATHWLLPHTTNKDGVDREIWLWDFAGQVDYRLVHQLFMDDTAAAVLVFNPQQENPFEGLGQWDRDLQKAARKPFAKLLAAGRVDRGGLVVSDTSINKFIEERSFQLPLHLTSAKTGEGCDDLRAAIVDAIDWQNIPETTSPVLYHRLKREILLLRDNHFVLIRLAELKQRMELALPGERFGLAELQTVVGLLAGPGMIQRIDFGGFILLRPEVLSRYAAAVVRKVRKHPQQLGCIREDEVLAGALDYQDFERLPAEDEAVVLRTLHETFVNRAWCLRQPFGNTTMLTFPSYFRRERPEQIDHPNVLVTYRFTGPVDDIYATLVVRLHHTEAFESDQLWKDAADFKTQTGQGLGLKLTRETEGTARLEIYFNPDVDENSRLLFLRYVHNHLIEHAKNVRRLRHYVCNNKKCDTFNQPFTDQARIDKALADGKDKIFCSDCGKPILLRDVMEQKFDSPGVKERARKEQEKSQFVIDNESRELIVVGHAVTITSEAGQIYHGHTHSNNGIDGEIECKDDLGRATGKRLYLQLKSGDSSLMVPQREGAGVFHIKNQQWADLWQQRASPVMLVVRMSDGEIRWMDVSDCLRHASGTKNMPPIIFEGERFDVMSVRRWRDKVLRETLP